MVDVGGNWLRIYRAGDSEEDDEAEGRSEGLARVVEVAARQGDSRGDDGRALDVLERGLARHPGAPARERARALLYKAELLVRLGRREEAATILDDVQAGLAPADAALLEDELAHARAL